MIRERNFLEVGATSALREAYEQGHIPLKMYMDNINSIIKIASDFDQQCRENDPIKVMWIHLKLVQKMIDENTDPMKKLITCRKGCSACCRMNVDITEVEGKLLIKYCQDHNIPIDEEYLKQQLGLEMETHMFSKHSACVFLKNNECSVYAARPIPCRKFFAVDDPKYCDPKANVNQSILFNHKLEIYASGLMQIRSGHMAEMLLDLLKKQRQSKHTVFHLPASVSELREQSKSL